MPDVRLTEGEAVMAAAVGVNRQIQSLRNGLRDAHGYDGADGWTSHIEGACGELAVAKLLGVYWDGSVGRFHTSTLGDVGMLHVRTRSRHAYDLIIRRDDADLAVYVLVTGRCPTYRVRGWIYGGDAKQERFLAAHGDRPAAFFVPASELLDVELLGVASDARSTTRA